MATTAATFPPPPPFYKLYKNDLISSAPPPPIEGTYSLYSATYTTDYVLPSLEEHGVRRIYAEGPNVNLKEELRALNRGLQMPLLELTDILVQRPSEYARKVEEIGVIFKNMHHILNSLRRHQAGETIILMQQLQLQRRKDALEDIKRRRQEAKELLQEALGTISDSKRQKLS